MFQIYSGEPGGPQKQRLADLACATPGGLWIAIDQPPPPAARFWGVWVQPPFAGMAAAAARWANPEAKADELRIPTLAGFSGPSQRAPVRQDHDEQTLQLATAVMRRQALPVAVYIAGLSTLYDQVLAAIASTTPHHWVEKAVELVPAYASAALSHWLFDLRRIGVPVHATCWEVQQGKRLVPHLPRSVTNLADAVHKE